VVKVASEFRRRRVGRLVRVPLIAGRNGVSGKEKDDVYNPGRFRRAGARGDDQLGGGHQFEFLRTWMFEMKKSGATHNIGAAAMRLVEARLAALEEENAA
jgi:hypothetical protein